MADPDKVPDSKMDTLATSDALAEEASQDAQPTESSMLSESQDFQLIDEETEKATQDETEAMRTDDNLPETNVKTSEDTEKSNAPTLVATKVTEQETEAEKRVSEEESPIPGKTENTTCTESEKQKEKAETEEDDDEFVPSSQVESCSPLKKQISGLAAGLPQKRKADNSEEPQAKIPRTCSQENALSDARKQFDDEEDIFASDLADETFNEPITTNVVIQETQESCEAEGDSESLQQVEEQLKEALSQQDENDTKVKSADNENLEKSSLAQVAASTEEKKASISEVLEERIVSTMSEAIKDKISSLTEANVEKESSNRDALKEKKSSENDASEKKKSSEKDASEKTKCGDENIAKETESSNAESVEKTKSSNAESVEKTKSSKEEAVKKTKISEEAEESSVSEAEKESPDNKIAKLEHSLSTETEKSEISAKNTEKKSESTRESTKNVSELKEDSSPVPTKDKEAQSAESNLGQKSEKSDNNSPEISNKNQSEICPPIKVIPNKSRMSIEVIYDKSTAPPEKKRPRELVEIDEDGEKIVLDSSQEGSDKSIDKSPNENKFENSFKTSDGKTASTDYKSVDTSKESSKDFAVYPLTNGSSDSKKASSSDKTQTLSSDSMEAASDSMKIEAITKVRNAPEVFISISDSEGDSFVSDERSKNQNDSSNRQNASIKVVEKEISIVVKMKCLVHIDENTKEHVEKIITSVHCEPNVHQDLSSTRRRNSDASACLADISGNAGDNRDASPGSVTSNPHPYPLNPRLSLASTTSSSSSSSSGSLNAKFVAANSQFQLPRIPVKHAKKTLSEASTPDSKSSDNESFESICKEWKHAGLMVNSFFNCARDELVASELHNGSSERVDSSMERIRSSTPELEVKDQTVGQTATPKSTNKRGRAAKRSRSKTVQSSGSNGLTKSSPVVEAETDSATSSTPSSSRKRKSSPETPSGQSANSTKDSTGDSNDELVGKEVFAKWSDNKYYPGTVIGKTKTKFKVNFYDGQNKLIIEDFIVPMPTTLQVGLSVYATSTDDDYGSCGIIIDAKKVKNNVIYTVQTDEQEEIRVQIKNIFLTNDQVQVLREETKVELKSPPSTPKHLGKVTLDNVVEGTRRSKRITTPIVLTPKAKRARGSLADKSVDITKPSSSGVASKIKTEEKNYDSMSDYNSAAEVETDLLGVQPEMKGILVEQETKGGPSSRFKSKTRCRRTFEDPEIVAKLGPIPPANSKIFSGMSFLLTCASLEIMDRFQIETKDSNSEPPTENEEEWTKKPFVRDRLTAQLTAGGGKVYDNFEQIPPEQYENTKLITNVPNLTKKSLLCLSVGIKAYNHQWIIRCCQENKIVNPSEEELPAGWSLLKQSYVEMFQRRNIKPFQTLPVIVVIPIIPGEKDFATFWTQICQNAGGAVLLPENPGDDFIEGTVVLTNKRCPSWVVEKAKSWSIPLVSTTWVIQSLIEGNICTYDAHPSFDYNYVKRQLSHISNLKRLQ